MFNKLLMVLAAQLFLCWIPVQAQNYFWGMGLHGVSSGQAEGKLVAFCQDGGVIAVGNADTDIDFDPGPATHFMLDNGTYVLRLDSSGNYDWSFRLGVTVFDMAVDMDGNIHLAGKVVDSVDVDPGPAVAKLYGNWAGSACWIKYSPTGTYIESFCLPMAVTSLAPPRSDFKYIDVDDDGNILLAGDFIGTGDVDPTSGVFVLTGSTFLPFAIKLTETGAFAWGRMIERNDSTGSLFFSAARLTSAGDAILVGQFLSVLDMDFGPATLLLDAEADGMIFILKLDLAGAITWAKAFGSIPDSVAADSKVADIAIFPDDGLLIGGYYYGETDVKPGPDTLMVNAPFPAPFLCRLDADGNLLWNRHCTTNNIAKMHDLTLGPQAEIFITGEFVDSMDLGMALGYGAWVHDPSGWPNAYLARYDSSGNFLWGGNVPGNSLLPKGWCVDASPFGEVVFTGLATIGNDFDFTSMVQSVPTSIDPSDYNGFIVKYSADTTIGIQDPLAAGPSLQAFPNPTSGGLTLRSEALMHEVCLTNPLGQVLMRQPVASREHTLTLSGLPPGVYLAKVATSDVTLSTRIVLH
jgi:hypothetical protein